MKIKNVKMIDVGEFDSLVEKTYERPYSFQQQDGCKDRGTFTFSVPEKAYGFENDTVPETVNHEEMGVSFKAWLARDPKQPLKNNDYLHSLGLWWNRNFYPSLQTVVNNLHEKGLLETGEYTINIDW